MVITFHGVITPETLKGFNGRGYVQQWLYVHCSVWHKLGTPCTYIFTEDVDHAASVKRGEIVRQARLHAIPGHLKGITHPDPQQAIAAIAECHFFPRNRSEAMEWLTKLTQEGRVVISDPDHPPQQTAKTCTCPIDTLMVSGCQCGSIQK